MLRHLFSIVGALLFATATCGALGGETITYVRKVSTTNFLGWGQAGFYFPQFAASSIVGPKRTDDNMQFYVPNWLEFNFDPWDPDNTTFSADQPDCFDNCSGRGVYTRGGYTNWDSFTLPNGFSGLSGSIVDEKAKNNTNNTVNQIRMKTGVPSSFCMHIVTDNTANAHNSANSIIVRGGRRGQGSFDPNAPVPDLSFDGTTDVHTFRFDNFLPDDFIKIRLNSGTPGMEPGFGGLMFDLACDYIPNEQCGNNVCDVTLGESCESCPGDCGACIPGTTPTRTWHHHGTDPQSHYVAGSNRLLIFAAHGVDGNNHWVQGVRYGNKNMRFLEARSQARNDKSTVSVWYLKEADIYSAGGTNFNVDWYHKPGQRSYESIFLTNVSQTFTFGSIDEAGCNDCYAVTCPWRTMEPGHISLYAGTHERNGGNFWPLNGYTQEADLWMGGNGKATIGHKNGIGNAESAGAQFGREGAFSLVCFEVQDMPQTDSDGDGVPDDQDNCIVEPNAATATIVAASLPSSRSVQVGSVASVFATVINTSNTAATDCGIAPQTSVPATFAYLTTDASSVPIGTPNTPVDIPACGAQDFIFRFLPTEPISPTEVELNYDCTNTDPAPSTEGLNTLLLSATAAPVPDIVALAATPSGDGIVSLAGSFGVNAFAVAIVNVGATGTLTASVDTGTATLPVSLSICETEPATGGCISPVQSSIVTTIDSNTTAAFAIFVGGAGIIPLDPATNRIYVRFQDGSGVTRGSTSVAVRTQ